MSGEAKIPWKDGLQLAVDLLGLIAGCYGRAAVAGSLRRGKPLVGDVELVLTPLYEGALNLLDQRFEQLLAAGTVTKRFKRDGSVLSWPKQEARYRAMFFGAIPVDVFIVLPGRQWGPIFVIRSGPHEANLALVASEGTRTQAGDAGVLPKGVVFRDGALWQWGVQIGEGPQIRLDTPEEVDVYAACGLPWLPPPERTASEYYRWSRKRVTAPCYTCVDFHDPVPTYPLFGRPPRDQVWGPKGGIFQLEPEIGEPTVRGGQSAPTTQQNLFA